MPQSQTTPSRPNPPQQQQPPTRRSIPLPTRSDFNRLRRPLGGGAVATRWGRFLAVLAVIAVDNIVGGAIAYNGWGTSPRGWGAIFILVAALGAIWLWWVAANKKHTPLIVAGLVVALAGGIALGTHWKAIIGSFAGFNLWVILGALGLLVVTVWIAHWATSVRTGGTTPSSAPSGGTTAPTTTSTTA